MRDLSDQELIQRALQGEMLAFRYLVERHQSFVYRVAYRMVGTIGDAEDITQESFLRLWKHLNRYKPDVKLTTWLYKIATNLCLDFLKSHYSRTTKQLVDVSDFRGISFGQQADQSLHDDELRDAIEKLTDALSPKQKAVFVLRDLEEIDMDEIANILAMEPGQVKSNLYYARRKISEMVSAYYQMKKEKP